MLCLNPHEAERERARRTQLLRQLDAELTSLDSRDEDHPKAACALIASRRYGRYLRADWRGRPQLDSAKIKAAEKFDGKFVVISNDDTLSAEDIALGYKGAWIIESCIRRMKQTGLEVRPMSIGHRVASTPTSSSACWPCRCNGPPNCAVSSLGRASPTRWRS